MPQALRNWGRRKAKWKAPNFAPISTIWTPAKKLTLSLPLSWDQPRPQAFPLRKWEGKSPEDEVVPRCASVIFVFLSIFFFLQLLELSIWREKWLMTKNSKFKNIYSWWHTYHHLSKYFAHWNNVFLYEFSETVLLIYGIIEKMTHIIFFVYI